MSLADQQIRLIVEEYFGIELDDSLLGKFQQINLASGDWLFRQDDPGDSLFFLVRGRLQVWDEAIHDEEATPRLLGEVVPGESVGEVGHSAAKHAAPAFARSATACY